MAVLVNIISRKNVQVLDRKIGFGDRIYPDRPQVIASIKKWSIQNICCPSALLEAWGFPPFFLSTTTMSPKDAGTTIVDQTPFVVPEISIKELLDAIPYIYYFFSPNQQFMLFLAHTASSVLPYGPLSTCKPKLFTTKARFFTSP
jgi:hypothetical protein